MILLSDTDQIGGALQLMRHTAHQSQRHIAETAGYRQAQISAWEHGRTPSLSSLIQLADALGYDLALVPREEA